MIIFDCVCDEWLELVAMRKRVKVEVLRPCPILCVASWLIFSEFQTSDTDTCLLCCDHDALPCLSGSFFKQSKAVANRSAIRRFKDTLPWMTHLSIGKSCLAHSLILSRVIGIYKLATVCRCYHIPKLRMGCISYLDANNSLLII